MIGEHNLHGAGVLPAPLYPAEENGLAGASRWEMLKEIYAITHIMYPAVSHHGYAKRSRFFLRTLRNFSVWQQWYAFLKSSPFEAITLYSPRLYEKPLRPYLHKDLTSAECQRILREHYLFLQQHAPTALINAILENQPFLLNQASISGLREPLLINFTYSKHMQQEGELTLSLGPPDSLNTLKQHNWIASLTFVIRYNAAEWEMVIGGVQGGRTTEARQDTKRATHVFHGLRPKHLLVYLLREVAAAWGIGKIYAISDTAHCYMRRRYQDRMRSMKSSYDELWRDVGGQLAANGFYALPAANRRRPVDTIPSRKRAQYLRRFALLDSIDGEIHDKLAVKHDL